MRIFLTGLAAAIALVLAIVIARTAMLPGPSGDSAGAAIPAAPMAAERLGEAIRIETVSFGPDNSDPASFDAFAAFLQDAYPAAHAAMERERFEGGSLLFRWRGSDSSRAPIGFIAHIDVVPVEPGTEGEWSAPPFSGAIEDGVVWGRGALDNKGQLIALMEAAERLAAAGFAPARDLYFLFGHDEEIGGENGAGAMAAALGARGVHFEWTLDEGSGLAEGVIPGVERPVALIATAEKGSTTLRITASAPGGHSSAPGKDTAVSLVSRAVVAIADSPYPLKIDEDTVSFLHAIAPELPLLQRAALANLWLTGPVIARTLGKSPTTAAALHTTTAPTMIDGGTKVNILPQRASAIVNYRIHPRDNVDAVRARAIRLIGDERIEVEALGGREPSPRASVASDGYRAIEQTTLEIFGAVPVAPFLTLQGTDTRHYTDLADDNYRFTPFIYRPDDLERIHGTDERAHIEDIERAAAWYAALIENTAAAE